MYENRLPPENINVGKTNVLFELFWLLAGLAAAVVLMVLVLYFAGGQIAKRLPFSWEAAYAERFVKPAEDERSQYLQKLAVRLSKGMKLPEGMEFRVSYVDDDEINAYASLGGEIRLHRGLLELLHSENAVAMVLAHEMAHVIHRDPAEAMGGRMLVGVALSVLSFATGADSLASIINPASSLTLMTFSREAEARADALGVKLVARAYGHVDGTEEVFVRLKAVEDKLPISVPEFMNTHPETAGRIKALEEFSEAEGVPLRGKLTPLPAVLRFSPE